MRVVKRGTMKRIHEEESRLLEEFDTEDLFQKDVPVTPDDIADLAYGIDLLQADMNGSLAWRSNAYGREVRDEIRQRLHSFEKEATRLHLETTARRLRLLLQLMDFDRDRP